MSERRGLKWYTVVYLDAGKKPKDTRKTELLAATPREALTDFLNDARYKDRELFVACVVSKRAGYVHMTLEAD